VPVRLFLEDPAKALAHHRVVVGKQDAQRGHRVTRRAEPRYQRYR
jgi:hypothetical protein